MQISAPRPAECETKGGPQRQQKGTAKPSFLYLGSAIKPPGQPTLGRMGKIFAKSLRDGFGVSGCLFKTPRVIPVLENHQL